MKLEYYESTKSYIIAGGKVALNLRSLNRKVLYKLSDSCEPSVSAKVVLLVEVAMILRVRDGLV
jgi:hypothetical protein